MATGGDKTPAHGYRSAALSPTESITTEVMGCSSSAEVWGALEALFGAHSKAKMDEYIFKIQTVRKGPMTMPDYLKQKRQWADVLALIGDPYPRSLLVSNQIERLSILFSNSKLSNNSSPSTNVANRHGSDGSHGPGNYGNRGRGVCGRYDHFAAYCYNRYDESYMGTTPTRNSVDGTKPNPNNAAFVATPEMLKDETCEEKIAGHLAPSHPMITRAKTDIFKPKPYVGKTQPVCQYKEPSSVQEALNHPGWRGAMDDENKLLVKNKTWILVPRLPNMNIVGYSDVDWACCPDDRKSIVGYCVYFGDALVCRALAQVSVELT
uniref:Uncharacterized protein n=1 Tax=Cannabis sativa TaxID=3483 RepID=A0A803QBG7_CANSA